MSEKKMQIKPTKLKFDKKAYLKSAEKVAKILQKEKSPLLNG